MSVLKNRHVVVAALVAPVLALIAWFSVDYFFAETPQAAVEGGRYALVEKPNCRWESGGCGLKNNDFELEIVFERLGGNVLRLSLDSVFPLDGVMLAVARDDVEVRPPEPMNPAGPGGTVWTLDTVVMQPGEERLRLVASAGGALYYGDVSTAFVKETGGG